MKLIDRNGRLFGKISIIDVLVVAVVLFLAVALQFKGKQTHTGSSVTEVPITYQVTVNGVRNYVADAIQVGDVLYDLDMDSSGHLGEITAIEVLPPSKMAELHDGTVDFVPAEDSVDLLLSVKAEGLIDNGRYLINRVYDLGLNASRNLYTPYAQFVGSVTSIG